ncbi:TPA: hypothetical protein ACX6S0_000583 [Photobacterium damselae]
MSKEDAEAWADKHCGEWRTAPLPKVKRIKSLSVDDEELEE